jgi:IclR family pca regulon transcriptional regulator
MTEAAGDAIALNPEGEPDDAPPDARAPDPRYIVPGLSRGLALLALFDRSRPARTLAELAEGLGVTRSAAYRLVYTLEHDGFIAREGTTRRYRLTSRVLELGFEYLNSHDLIDLAAPVLRRLADATAAAAHLVALDGWHVVYLARALPPPASAMVVSNLRVGTRLPCHITASGRALLACLDEMTLDALHRRIARESDAPPPPFAAMREQAAEDRRRGFVFRPSIIDPGFMTFAAAVPSGADPAVAAINVIGAVRAMSEERGEAVLREAVLGATASLSRQLGHRGA